MIYELRTYAIKPANLAAYLKLWEGVGIEVRKDSQYGQLVGFWISEFGDLNQVVHLWAYPSLNERAAIRAALMRDVRWTQEFLPQAFPMIDHMKSVILNAASFSPMQ